MAYTREMLAKAERILENRRDTAEIRADLVSVEIRNKLPEVDRIQSELSKIGLEISRLFFYRENAPEKVEELKQKSKALVSERSTILVSNGYSENAMKPEYICPICDDKGYVSGRMCSCHKQILCELMRQEVSSFAPLENCTFDNFSLDKYENEPNEIGVVPKKRAESISNAAHQYAQNFSLSSKNLLFLGSTGLGKTHLSLAIANIVINKGFSVCYGTSQNICEDLRAEMFGRDNNISYTKSQVLGCDLLILDDLGTEIDNQYNTATIYNIVNSRILSGRPTIISTNYEIRELEDKYDQRITSRISGEYTHLKLFGKDNRI